MKVVHSLVLTQSKGSNVVLLLDFSIPAQRELVNLVIGSEIPATIMDIQSLRKIQKERWLPLECPAIRRRPNMTDVGPVIDIEPDKIYTRKRLLTSDHRSPLSLIVWASGKNIEVAASIFEDDVMWCKQKVDMGLLHKDNKFMVAFSDKNETHQLFRPNSHLSNHPKVALISLLNNYVAIWNRNFYSKVAQDGVTLNQIQPLPSHKDYTITQENIFDRQRTLNGKTINILSIPMDLHIEATPIKNPKSNQKMFKDRWGLSIYILQAIQERLNFKVEFWNPYPMCDYGELDSHGSWTGGMKMVHDHTCDVIIDWSYSFERCQIMSIIPMNYLDYETFSSPVPHPKSNFLAIVTPYQSYVWILIMISVPAMGFLNNQLALMEGYISGKKIKPWASLGRSLWYSFGTLQGESITRDINMKMVTAIRYDF